MMEIKVLFFGPARDWTGVDEIRISVSDGATLGETREALARRYPLLGERMRHLRFAVNDEFAGDGSTLHAGAEVAVIPPVSGGNDDPVWIELVHEPIDGVAIRRFVGRDLSCGGINTFDGLVRDDVHPDHGRLIRLDYQAYEGMALKKMRDIAEQALSRWSARRVAMIHRLGAVPLGEVAVAVAAACPHRKESFAACRFLIDALKTDVPIWKQDVFEDGYVKWVEPPCPNDPPNEP